MRSVLENFISSGQWPVASEDNWPLTLVMRRRQALAPFGAATFEDELAALRAHADAEAVRLGAAAIVWLKSSLRHCLHLSINVSTEKGKPIGLSGWLSSLSLCPIRQALPLEELSA